MKDALKLGACIFVCAAFSTILPGRANADVQKKILEITYDGGAKQTVLLNQPSSAVASLEFKAAAAGPAVETPFGASQPQGSRTFRGDVVFLNEGTSFLPDLSGFSPVATLYTSTIDVAPRRFDSGFPGIPNRTEWFGIKYTGEFYVHRAGIYKFRAVADDGVALMVDGRTVLEDRGTHGPRSSDGEITLYEGLHSIRLDYFQGPKYDIACQLFVAAPGQQERIFDISQYDY